LWKDSIQIGLDLNLKIKILDFGNGCWTNKHFTQNIQTREYRGIETILDFEYQDNVDIWSLACMVFELLTADYLFKPKQTKYASEDDDHLALMIETLGPIPKKLL
jgi:serine/threonine protein kinase